jgi:hypothetical protein
MVELFGLMSVTVSVLVPLAAIVVGLNVFRMVVTTKATLAVCVIVTPPLDAVYVTVSATVFLTVNVTMPLASDVPLAAEMVDEVPALLESVTVCPEMGKPNASSSVTVMVEVLEPFASTVVGLAVTVELVALIVTASVALADALAAALLDVTELSVLI